MKEICGRWIGEMDEYKSGRPTRWFSEKCKTGNWDDFSAESNSNDLWQLLWENKARFLTSDLKNRNKKQRTLIVRRAGYPAGAALVGIGKNQSHAIHDECSAAVQNLEIGYKWLWDLGRILDSFCLHPRPKLCVILRSALASGLDWNPFLEVICFIRIIISNMEVGHGGRWQGILIDESELNQASRECHRRKLVYHLAIQ